jgi:predicted patatin/cPLA2 family phospholipase
MYRPEFVGTTKSSNQNRGALAEVRVKRAPMNGRKLGIVVEGGGLRGAFCAGALQALAPLLPRPADYVFATSSGAPSAAFYALGQIDRAVRLWERWTHASHLVSPRHLLRGRPIMDVDKLVNRFRGQEPLEVERFASVPTQAIIAVTNCRAGQAEFLRMTERNAFPLLTATMALPFAYGKVITIDGQPYIDGGVCASIPIQPALERDIDDIIVLLTQPSAYRKRLQSVAPSLLKLAYPGYPDLVHAIGQRSAGYNRQVELIARLEARRRVWVVRPKEVLPASRITRDRDRIMQSLELGRQAATAWFHEAGGLIR